MGNLTCDINGYENVTCLQTLNRTPLVSPEQDFIELVFQASLLGHWENLIGALESVNNPIFSRFARAQGA